MFKNIFLHHYCILQPTGKALQAQISLHSEYILDFMKQEGQMQKNTNPPKNHQQNNNPHLRLNYLIPYWNQWQLKEKNTNTDYFFANSQVFIHLANSVILGSKSNIAMILCINLSTK